MKYVLTLNKIEECLIAPRVALHAFQLQSYGQYGMHGSIVNVPTNLNIMQNILPRMPYDDSLIVIFFKGKLKYKSIYMSSYIHLNIVMKILQEHYQTPLYKRCRCFNKTKLARVG
jgi:hypothetical protein